MSDVAQRLRAVVDPVIRARGLDLEDLAVTPAGRRRRVQIVVDKDGGVSLDECADVSADVSAALDSADTLGDAPYALEVSSPGVTRPLTAPRHWRRNTGRLVRAALHDGRTVTGRVVEVGEDAAVLDVDGARRDVPYGDVARASVEVEFRRSDAAAGED